MEDSESTMTLEACLALCTPIKEEPDDPSDPVVEDDTGSDDGTGEEGVCKEGTYWCDTLGACITVDKICP